MAFSDHHLYYTPISVDQINTPGTNTHTLTSVLMQLIQAQPVVPRVLSVISDCDCFYHCDYQS